MNSKKKKKKTSLWLFKKSRFLVAIKTKLKSLYFKTNLIKGTSILLHQTPKIVLKLVVFSLLVNFASKQCA